ncbi:MAG: UPF0058 family protein [Candidatus Thermoplasmatota archaeon]|nr:UPF0058 family protein [Candidatus Thermoplasmatota archaeon]
MHKNELIQLHTLLCQIKNHFEEDVAGEPIFRDYESVGVQPTHVHRSKSDHKRAIFVLGKELAGLMSDDEFSGPARVSNRLEKFASKLERPAEVASH